MLKLQGREECQRLRMRVLLRHLLDTLHSQKKREKSKQVLIIRNVVMERPAILLAATTVWVGELDGEGHDEDKSQARPRLMMQRLTFSSSASISTLH